MATLDINQLAQTPIIRDTTSSGSDIFKACTGGGDVMPNAPNTFAVFENKSGGSLTVTFAAVTTTVNVEGFGTAISTPNVTAIINDGGNEEYAFVALPPNRFNNASGQVGLSYSGVTSLKVAIFQLAVNK